MHAGPPRDRLRASALCLALLVLGLPARAPATILANWSLEEVLARADVIGIGEIVGKRSLEVDGVLMTETEVAVERCLLGACGERLVVSQLGGKLGGVESSIVGDARLNVGARMLLVTYRHRDGRRYLVGMSLGAYLVDGESLVQRIDASLTDARGVILPAPGVRRLRLVDFEATLGRVRR